MNHVEIQEYLLDFQKRALPELVDRELEVNGSNKIKSIIGPRRAGKTSFQFKKIGELMASGVEKERILYLNFEDPRLVDVHFKEIRDIIKVHWQLYPASTSKKCIIFFDEPQMIENWEIAVRALHDEGFEIFLTGSSSRLLSKEISTSLRGRTLSYLLLPFSFKEFLEMEHPGFDPNRLSSKEKSLLKGLLDQYLEFGGFPEIILEENPETRLRILNEYFNLVVYRDVVERYKIKNTLLIKWLVKSMTVSYSKEFSVHKQYLTLKSKGIKASKNTLYSYLSMLEDSVFVFLVPRFDYSIRKRDLSIHKVYLCDVGFARLTEISRDYGRKMENVVFLELERRKRALTDIFYWKNPQQEVVDFVVQSGGRVEQLIQVCRDVDDANVKKREVRALVKASDQLECDDLLVITGDYDSVEEHKGKGIRFIPLWMWLTVE
ncbi:MAG TPA: ATP-binding protein [Methanosarcinales archaeon]|nr:ATP-binding protein [Methanosarcinales archaeon]